MPRTPMDTSPTRAGWMLAAGGGVLLLLVLATEVWVWINLWPITATWGEALLWSLPQLYVWMLLVPAVLWFAGRMSIEGGSAVPRAVVHAGTSVAFALAALLIVDVSDDALHWTRLLGAPSALVASMRYTIVHLHFGIAVYWIALGGVHAVRYYGKYRERAAHAVELETELATARLAALRAQLQPHFLFNTLNSIAVLMRRDPDQAERMLHQLSGLLRTVLEEGAAHEVSLANEMAFVRQYLQIEETRFHDRLTVQFDVADEVLSAVVPSLLLQPIVENAVRHGIAPHTRPGTVTVRARRVGDDVRLVVLDDGPGIAPGANGGVGLDNTRRRLATLYGAGGRLDLANRPEGGAEVTVTIPYRAPVTG